MGRFVLALISFLLAAQVIQGNPRENSRDPAIQPRPQVPAPGPIDLKKTWQLPAIRLAEVWKVQRGNPETVIAVVDSGIHYNHRDLTTNLVRRPPFSDPVPIPQGFKLDILGWDFVQNDHRPWDRTGHGTFVSGLAAGILGSRDGGAGVCPGCSILTARFMNSEGTGDDDDCLKAMEYAIQARPAVMNLSFGGEGYDREYEKVLEKSLENDVVVVVAAGNDGENNDSNSIYPANFNLPNLITVAATERDGTLWEDSNYGKKKVHIAAPGVELWGPWNDGTYYAGTGTSYAAPLVSGAVGLIRSQFPQLSAPEVVELLMRSALPNPALTNKVRSGGALDVQRAFQLAVSATWNRESKQRRAYYQQVQDKMIQASRKRSARETNLRRRQNLPRFQLPSRKGEDFRLRRAR